ncbi:MAG: glycosyltransferase, partial [Candidatus Saccharibacteria bacterium]|nr:glycosyltransferase [Pseudorhodobacter sp.]
MSKNADIADLNGRLLALYLRAGAASDPLELQDIVTTALHLRGAFQVDQNPNVTAMFSRYIQLIRLHLNPTARASLDAQLATTLPLPTLPPAFAGHGDFLAPLTAEGHRGISVVTCSMNRTENLIRAIPSWLANPEIAEVMIVDWSSRQPVEQDLAQAGIADPRIRILRVEGEPRWILSYAFNAGFRAAACDTILKVDADIVLSPDFFQRNHVAPGRFIAGNWRSASADQAHVNGFFCVSRQALQRIGGFNEHITTYGWDDDDIYDRMTLSGLRRSDVAPGTIFHLDHDDEDRLGEVNGVCHQTVGARLSAGTKFMIRRNRYLAMVMPHWDGGSNALPFRTVSQSPSLMTIRRDGWEPSAVPGHVQAAARIHALTELLAWRLGRRVLELEPAKVELLLERGNGAVSAVDVGVAIGAPHRLATGDRRDL